MEDNEELKNIERKYFLTGLFLVIIVAFVSSAITYYYVDSRKDTIDVAEINKSIENATETNLNKDETFDAITETLKSFRTVIDQYYIGEIDEKNMLEETIKGYVAGLDDEYSEYMTKEDWEEFQTNALGNYVGVGIYMTMDKNNNIVVISPIKDSPAEKAGVQSGDIIVEINGESAIGMKTDEASSKIKGEPGSKVKLKLLRDSEEYVDLELERKEIKIYHVNSEMKTDDIGYIQLLTFDEGCANEVKKAYKELEKQGAKKIIFDLRDNTGGLVDEALSIADFMIDKDKKILITKDAKGKEEVDMSNSNPAMDCPIVVLVNQYSASASEILTGALKDNGEAQVVGTTTYGKGVIQSVIPLKDGSVLKLTVAEYFTPNGTKINKIGIEPDYKVESVKQEKDEEEVDEQLEKALELLK